MTRQSAGLLLFRRTGGGIEVLLVHPGGPFWKNKDGRAWSVPKGEFTSDEDVLVAARREFLEETGFSMDGPFIPLAPVRQSAGKTVHVFAVEGDCDATAAHGNTFTLEWPPRSGNIQEFPEIDRAAWFTLEQARQKLHAGQVCVLDRLLEAIAQK